MANLKKHNKYIIIFTTLMIAIVISVIFINDKITKLEYNRTHADLVANRNNLNETINSDSETMRMSAVNLAPDNSDTNRIQVLKSEINASYSINLNVSYWRQMNKAYYKLVNNVKLNNPNAIIKDNNLELMHKHYENKINIEKLIKAQHKLTSQQVSLDKPNS